MKIMEAKWLNDPRFNNIDKAKKAYLITMLEQMEGKSMSEAMKVYMQTASKMKQEGLTLTQAEGSLMVEYLMQSMSPAEKQKWDKISKYMKNRN